MEKYPDDRLFETNLGEITIETSSPSLSIQYDNKSPAFLPQSLSLKTTKHKHPPKNLKRVSTLMETLSTCINCTKSFSKSCNFHWSCCHHRSKWNGFSYLCCSQKFETATGCVSAKHISSDDISIKCIEKCSSCRETGHSIRECPNDPNARTQANPLDELQRISSLRQHKNVNKIMSTRKYEPEDNFSDIRLLRNEVKSKKGKCTGQKDSAAFCLSTEDDTNSTIVKKSRMVFKSDSMDR